MNSSNRNYYNFSNPGYTIFTVALQHQFQREPYALIVVYYEYHFFYLLFDILQFRAKPIDDAKVVRISNPHKFLLQESANPHKSYSSFNASVISHRQMRQALLRQANDLLWKLSK